MPTRTMERTTFLSDIIIGAVEGGTGYWAQVSGYKWSDEHPETTRATLHDMEDGEAHELNVDVVATGLQRVLELDFRINDRLRADIRQANEENDAGEIDADGADAIVQAAIFGELVYG